MYKEIFFTNVLRFLDEQGMSKQDLSRISQVSLSFISEMTTGKANPSLEKMEAVAKALDVPLPVLLESTDMDQASLDLLAGRKAPRSLPPGYERVSVILPEHRAFQVRQWGAQAVKEIHKET